MPVVKRPSDRWTAPPHRPMPQLPASPTAEGHVLAAIRELRAAVDRDRLAREELLVELRALGRHLAVLAAATYVRLDGHGRWEVEDMVLDDALADVETE